MTVPVTGSGRGRPLLALSHTGLRSGAEIVLVRLLRWASEDGWDVVLLCPPGDTADDAGGRGIRVVTVPDLKLSTLPKRLAVAVAAARGVVAGYRARRVGATGGVIVANGLLGLPALWLARRLGMEAPTAWLVHDVIHRPSWRRQVRRFGSVVDVAIAVSSAASSPLAELGLPTVVVRNGTPWPVEPAPPVGAPPFRIGCTALLTAWKGQEVLLEAVAMTGRDDIVVELVGGRFPKDAEYVERLERRAAAPDLAGRVRFLGHVDDALVHERTWTIGVSASTDPEAGPLALLEYMSIGLPSVVTDHGGSVEVLGQAGITVPPGDPTSMAAAINRLLDDPATRARCGAAGRQQVADGLTLDHQRTEIMAVLGELAHRGRRRACGP